MLGSASADPVHHERVALVAIDLGPKVATYLRAKATTQIEEGLAAAGYDVLPTAQVAPRLTGDLATCREGPCVRSIADALGVASVVFATITSKDESSIITMSLYDVESARPVAEVREVCDLCGDSELVERLGVAASALRVQATEARERKARLAAQSKPIEHVPPPQVQATEPEPQRSLVPGIAVGVTGVAAIGVGIYLIALDGRGTCSPGDEPVYPAQGAVIRYPDPTDPGKYVCRDIYRTKTLGIVGAGLGAAAAALGVALIVHSHHRGRTVEVEPTAGGASVKVSLSW